MLREVTPSEGVSVVDPRYVRLGSVSPERADTFGQLTEVEKHWVHEPCSLRGLWQLYFLQTLSLYFSFGFSGQRRPRFWLASLVDVSQPDHSISLVV